MFTPDPTITDLNVQERNIVKVLFSMNIPQVATPELSVEDAKCYIFFFREGGMLSAFIALYLPRTDRRIYYSYSSNPFPEESMAEVEDEARHFVEDMGFLLDELYFSGISLEQKNRWMEEQDLFSRKKQARHVKPVEAEATSGGPPRTAFISATERPNGMDMPAEVLKQAVKAGIVKPPKHPVKPAGLVAKDKEALARLLASF